MGDSLSVRVWFAKYLINHPGYSAWPSLRGRQNDYKQRLGVNKFNRHDMRCTISIVSQCNLVSGWRLWNWRSSLPCGRIWERLYFTFLL